MVFRQVLQPIVLQIASEPHTGENQNLQMLQRSEYRDDLVPTFEIQHHLINPLSIQPPLL